jgi:hypothetical protein
MNMRPRSQGIATMSRAALRLLAGAALLLVTALTIVQPASAAPRAAHPAQPKSTSRAGGPGVPVRPAPVSLISQ